MPPFDTQYAVLPGIGQSSWTDVMLMIAPAAALGDHLLGGDLGAEERALEVDRQHAVVLGLGRVEDRRARLDARVVDHDVETSEGADGGGDEPLEVLVLADVGVDADRLVAEGDDLLLEVLGRLLVRHVVDDDVGPGRGETERHRLADAAVASGDDGHLSVQCHLGAFLVVRSRWMGSRGAAAARGAGAEAQLGPRGEDGGELADAVHAVARPAADEVGDHARPPGLVAWRRARRRCRRGSTR